MLINQKNMLNQKIKLFLLVTILNIFTFQNIYAVRPFITDDATVIGKNRHELATWTFINNEHYEFWHSYSAGITNKIEIFVALCYGIHNLENENKKQFTYAAPLLQTKFILNEYEPNSYPGLIIAAGSDLPFGKGLFVPKGYGGFIFASATQCLGNEEEVLIHAQIGENYLRVDKENLFGFNWGIGTQIKLYSGLHGVAELVAGDPYINNAGSAYQLGFRHFVNDNIQFDLAFGKGFGGDNRLPFWISGGIRLVFDKSGGGFSSNGRKIG